MDIQWMKRVDRFAGYPLCGLIRAVDLVRPGPAGDIASLEKPGAKIGIVKFWGMGSLILSTPVFRSLRARYPEAEVHLITLRPNQGIIDLIGIADQVHYLDLAGGPAKIGANVVAYLSALGKIGLDAVIDLEYLTRFSAIAAYMTGAPIRVGFHSWDLWRGQLHTERRAFNPYWHVTENFINLCGALGADDDAPEPARLELGGAEDLEAAELLLGAGVLEDERVIAVNVNASTMALARRWPEAYFVELIDRVVEQGLGRAVMIGAPDEAAFVERVKARTKRPDRVVSLAGRSSLSGLVGLLRRAALLVTNDSGPLHLAGAVGTRTVSFFGPETPSLYGPRGDRHAALYRGIDCSPCINIYNAKTVRCMRDEPECLTGIGVDEAMAAVERALAEQS